MSKQPDGRNVNLRDLNERRAEAVRLRLGGASIDDTARAVGLSRPTVIKAYKAYEARGWEGVPVARRGRATRGARLGAAENVHRQQLTLAKAERSALMGQKPFVVWFTGLSAAGKSTIADRVELRLHESGYRTYVLDGDNVRYGLNRDLGFTDADRVENIRRVAEVAKLMVDAGLIVLVSFISPFRSERSMARELFEPGEFVEVYVNTPLAVAEERDPKGLYRKARRGELVNFTGIDSPYEPPEAPELELLTVGVSPAAAAERVLERLAELHLLPARAAINGA